ncbi:MAG: transcriptional repressor LexA [Planctomycetota bacterium]
MARPFTTELTRRQKAVLDWVKDFMRRNGLPPTVREIGRAFGYSSSSVFDYLKVLERKGWLFRRRELGPRSLVLADEAGRACPHCEQVQVVGRIAAGKPLLAAEDDLGTVTVARNVGVPGEVYALLVQGDSMIDAGILDGDVVLIRKQDTADDGDIVVALIDDEATLKILRRQGRRVKLAPANRALQPLYVDAERLKILGKLVNVQRRYG